MYKLSCWEKRVVIDKNDVFGAIEVLAPARFDFIGGWTDTPPYYFDNDASVLNSTLSLTRNDTLLTRNFDVGKEITITIQPSKEFIVHENNKRVEHFNGHLIIKNVLEFLELDEPEISLSITNTIPKESGLGGSSLVTGALLAAFWGYYKGKDYIQLHLNELINNILLIEQLMGSGGGWQDQIGGFIPGVKLIETTREKRCNYSLSHIEENIEQLNSSSLIIDSRIQRKGFKILNSIRQKYLEHDPKAFATLKNIAVNAKLGFRMLKENDIASFAELMSESWQIVNDVESCSVELIDVLKRLCGNDISGMKIGGAGGGFILAIFKDPEIKEYNREKIEQHFKNCFVYNPIFGASGLSCCQPENLHDKEKKYSYIEKINNI